MTVRLQTKVWANNDEDALPEAWEQWEKENDWTILSVKDETCEAGEYEDVDYGRD